jgi:glutathione S-transferase
MMRRMGARLYGMAISHPANAARLMLEHKGIEHEIVLLQPGAQAVRIRLAGFRGGTVPALRIDGRRALGSRAISRLLDEIQPDPPLFPAAPDRRRAVEEAEAWGEEVLQPIPRRAWRWALRHRHELRVSFARTLGNPRPELMARFITPVAAFYARREDARSDERIRRDSGELPGHLDHVDTLIAQGVLDGPQLNAADFQIGTTVRVLLAAGDYEPLVTGRPCEALARRVWPVYPYGMPPLLPDHLRPSGM